MMNGTSVGSHWFAAGSNTTHGCPEAGGPRHGGDLGVWTVASGAVGGSKETELITWDIDALVGHAIVIHALPDDCINISSSGARIAFGVIGYTNITGASYTAPTTLATAHLRATDAVGSNNADGVVWFKEEAGEVKIYGEFTGLVDLSIHGLHIHAWGDVSHRNGTFVGAHWDPAGTAVHALPPTMPRHAGDLGNINTYSGGKAYYAYSIPTSVFTVSQIIGRGLVLHSQQDDGCTQSTGNSGVRVAQGTIGIASAAYFPAVWPTPPVTVPAQVGSSCTPVAPAAPVVATVPKTASAASVAASFALLVAGALFALVL